MASNSRHLGRLLGTDTKIKTDDIAGGVQLGLSFYTDEASLPTEGNILGAKAYAELEGTLHLWNGYGWGPIAVTAWDYEPWYLAGSISGYASAGSAVGARKDRIDKFPFAADGNATVVGALTAIKTQLAGNSSTTTGYVSGGFSSPTSASTTAIDKFSFASDGNATLSAGVLSRLSRNDAGTSSELSGYSTGKDQTTLVWNIDKFSFASDDNATNVGLLTVPAAHGAGQSSTNYGYRTSGSTPPSVPAQYNVIDKWPFAADGNATDVGDLTVGRNQSAGQSSTIAGYSSGGATPNLGGIVDIIDKFPFASENTATDVGNMTNVSIGPSGQSGTTAGYASGGQHTISEISVIDKFLFATDGNAVNVGSLTQGRRDFAGHQY